jgi:polyribonucleotide nucleotidyltransferase
VITVLGERVAARPIVEEVTVEAHKRSMFVGPAGTNLRRIQSLTGCTLTPIDDESGGAARFSLFAPSRAHYAHARTLIDSALTAEREQPIEFGAIYQARVTEVLSSGVLVRLFDGVCARMRARTLIGMRPALVPNSQLDTRPIAHASALGIEVGDTISVKCFGRDEASGALRLSRRLLLITQPKLKDHVRADDTRAASRGGSVNANV